MNFKHQIKLTDKILIPALYAEKTFRGSFNAAAYDWFKTIAHGDGYNKRVKDTTIAGHHFVNADGDCLTLH